jgi:predicted Zn-dependent protease
VNDEWKIRIKKIVPVIVVAIGLAIAAGYCGRPAYRHFKEKRGVAQGRVFFSKGDYRNAWLSVRQALLVNSNNVQACRIMAELEDAVHSPATLDWCQRVVQLSPAVSNKLLLASAGLRYQSPPYPLTSQMLDDLSASAAGEPNFHILSAELDLSLHRMAEAETQFEAACQLEPANRLFQLNLAVIRLGLTNAAAATEARAKLEQFRADTNLGLPALRSLIADRLLHDDAAGALNFSTQLLANAQANLNDRLQHIGILKRLQSPALTDQLNALQRDAATNAPMAAQTASWMEDNGFLSETVPWLNTLPANIKTQPPVRLALADGYLNATNWMGLRNLTASGEWGEMDFLRLAFLSRAWSELGEPLVADGDWRSAVSEAGERLGALTALLELANRWQLPREQEDLLWRILRGFPDARWAQDSLERFYYAAGNTAGLYKLYTKQFPRSPQNVVLKNNLAATALLLKTNLTQACQLAAELYAQNTNEPPIVSTYAYALHLQGRDQEGLAALQKLKPPQLEQPSVALYYGVLLRAVGQTNEAARFLALAQIESSLLPEEKQLLSGTMGGMPPPGVPVR